MFDLYSYFIVKKVSVQFTFYENLDNRHLKFGGHYKNLYSSVQKFFFKYN